MVHEGEMRRSEDEFSDTISRGMSAAVAIVISSPCRVLLDETRGPGTVVLLLSADRRSDVPEAETHKRSGRA